MGEMRAHGDGTLGVVKRGRSEAIKARPKRPKTDPEMAANALIDLVHSSDGDGDTCDEEPAAAASELCEELVWALLR